MGARALCSCGSRLPSLDGQCPACALGAVSGDALIQTRVPKDVELRFKALAARRGETVAALTRKLVLGAVDRATSPALDVETTLALLRRATWSSTDAREVVGRLIEAVRKLQEGYF